MNEYKIFKSFSERETFEFAKKIGEGALSGDIFCLTGDLGVGKTAFAKGFAKGLGIHDEITSPTFTIVNEHKGLFHFDVYRVKNIEEMYQIGYEEYFFGKSVCLVEWADLIVSIIPNYAIWINIEKQFDENLEEFRVIKVSR